MLVENIDFLSAENAAANYEGVFRYCKFSSYPEEGGISYATYVGCVFENLDLYMCMFNGCIFVDCKFKSCTFRGTTFPNVKLVDCEFNHCKFIEDNMGGACLAENSKWYGSYNA
jgi:uncharacterized protein YjbI with pentapeptide repeats